MRKTVACILSLVVFYNSFAAIQGDNDKNLSYTLALGRGSVLQTNDFVKGINADGIKITDINSIAFKISTTVNGKKAWHHQYNDLRFGIGGFYGRFNYYRHLHNPAALYGFIGFTPFKHGKFSIKNETALGVSAIWDCYTEDNLYNVAVSMPVEAYIHWNLDLCYSFTPSWQIALGIGAVHFSNGALVKPNKGINAITPQLSFTYSPLPAVKYGCIDTLKHDNTLDFLVSTYYGLHADLIDDSLQKSSTLAGIQMRFVRALSYKYNFGLGFDVSYNDRGGESFNKSLSISTYLAFAYDINDLSVILEPALYIKKSQNAYYPKQYQRIGLRYAFNSNFFAQLALRAYDFHRADYIEWTVGYKFSKI